MGEFGSEQLIVIRSVIALINRRHKLRGVIPGIRHEHQHNIVRVIGERGIPSFCDDLAATRFILRLNTIYAVSKAQEQLLGGIRLLKHLQEHLQRFARRFGILKNQIISKRNTDYKSRHAIDSFI